MTFRYGENVKIYEKDILTGFLTFFSERGGGGSCDMIVKLFVFGVRGTGFDSWSRRYDFRDW